MKLYVALLAICVTSTLSSCAALVVAGAGTAAVAAHDRRTFGAFIDDQTIEMKAGSALKSDDEVRRDTNINVTSMNGIVLLSGEAATPELRDRALAKMRELGGIRRIVNEIQIAPIASLASRSYDAWITTKVKTKLIHTEDIDSTRVKVVTENDAVYLMGLVTQKEGELATDAARSVQGATRVVKLFEYID
jgi:osmotically-inducible protein OsmY